VGSLQLSRVFSGTDLDVQRPLRHVQDENAYAKIQEIIDDLKEIIAADEEEDEQWKGQA